MKLLRGGGVVATLTIEFSKIIWWKRCYMRLQKKTGIQSKAICEITTPDVSHKKNICREGRVIVDLIVSSLRAWDEKDATGGKNVGVFGTEF